MSESMKAMQDYTYVSKYALYNKEKKRRETWEESCDRMIEMHVRKFPTIESEIKDAFKAVKEKRVLASQRALQFGGVPIERHNARMYNCSASYIDRIRFFQECMYLLLCGSGTGFSVQKQHVSQLPDLSYEKKTKKTFVIPDSIEGWADSIGILIGSYFTETEFPEYQNCDVKFIYDEIRPEGSLFSHGVGKAPGHKGLQVAHEKIKELLDNCISRGQKKLRSIDAYDIVMHSSDAVLSGGVRRSATICLFSLDDDEMMKAKTGNWFRENPQRGRSNNTVMLLRDKVSQEQFNEIFKKTKEFGEPGFGWTDDEDFLFNPCYEIGFLAYLKTESKRVSGWQFCNLCEINGKKCKTKEEFYTACRSAAIVGTLQASYTDFPYLGSVTEEIVRKEALLGVSITGIMDCPEVLLDPEVQKHGAEIVVVTNKEFAKLIGINQASRSTCVKPAGTTSCILGTSSGIHPHHAKKYMRRIQANKQENPLQFFKQFNPQAVEESVWSQNNTDDVITFCIEVPDGAKTKNQINAIKLLDYVRITQNNWVKYGRVDELCVDERLTHNVSNTISVKEDEWDEVAEYLYKHRKDFAGVSLLSSHGDKDYKQAPFCTVHTPKEIVNMYGDASIFASGLIEEGLKVFDNDLWDACDALLGVIRVRDGATKDKWVKRAKNFAAKHFAYNYKELTYCLKDVHNWKIWCDLSKNHIDIDYTLMVEDDDFTKIQDTVACAGGSCQI